MRYIVFSDYNIIETEIKFLKRQKIWQRQIGSYQIPIRADKLFLMISKLTNRIDLSKYPRVVTCLVVNDIKRVFLKKKKSASNSKYACRYSSPA